MRLEPKKVKVSPATGASKSSTNTALRGDDVHNVTQPTNRIRAKLLRSLLIIATTLATFASAKEIEYERGSDAAASSASQVAHVALNNAGISCSVDSAYGPDFLWTRWYNNAILTIDVTGASALVLFDDETQRDTSCTDESSVRVTGAMDIEFSHTADGGQYLVRTSGRSMGFVQVSARELIARIVDAAGVVTFR